METKTIRVRVGTTNKTKLQAVHEGFKQVFKTEVEVIGVEVPSKVSDMPTSDAEAVEGARNRAVGARSSDRFDFLVGIEGSVTDDKFGFGMTSWAVIISSDAHESIACGARVPLPVRLKTAVLERREELADLFKALPPHLGYTAEGGPMGYLTGSAYSRQDAIRVSIIVALAPHLRKELYSLS